jgi:predicted RNA binding protein YcfA (HicA-like mRNA interferase family)
VTRLPRDVAGDLLVTRLGRLGYTVTRQSGSHARLTTTTAEAEHHVTVPLHASLKIGTLSAILQDVAQAHRMTRDELLAVLFDR